jgi:NitT/TauT family transport system substrate-binding protein
MYFTSSTYAQSDPKVVEAFATAMKKSLAYAAEHPDEARAVLATYTKIDPKVQAAVTLPGWPAEINKESVQKLSDLAQQDKLLTTAPDLTALLP